MSADVLARDALGSAFAQMAGLLLLVRFLDVWEREPLWLVAIFAIWGGVFAIGIAGPVNDARLDTLSRDFRSVWGAAWVAPTDEEPIKGAALVLAYLLALLQARRRGATEFDGPIDGLVYGAAIGLGFGFVEDLSYTLTYGLGVLKLRLGFLGLLLMGHAVYTGAFGAGLGLGTWSRTWRGRIGFPLLGLAVAMFLHFVHNGLVPLFLVSKYGFHTTAAAIEGQPLPHGLASSIDSTGKEALTFLHVLDYGVIAAFFIAFVYWIAYQRRVLVAELSEEVRLGVVSAEEAYLITHYAARVRSYLALVLTGRLVRLHRLRRRHRRVTELAFCKWRISRVDAPGEVSERHQQRIALLRQALAAGGGAAAGAAGAAGVAAPRRAHDARNALILGTLGLLLGSFILPLIGSLAAIRLGLRARRAAPDHSVPAGLVLGVVGLAIWIAVYAIAIANAP